MTSTIMMNIGVHKKTPQSSEVILSGERAVIIKSQTFMNPELNEKSVCFSDYLASDVRNRVNINPVDQHVFLQFLL